MFQGRSNPKEYVISCNEKSLCFETQAFVDIFKRRDYFEYVSLTKDAFKR
jgi:hypothetical protein